MIPIPRAGLFTHKGKWPQRIFAGIKILLLFVSLSIISTQLSAQKTTITVNGTTYQLNGTNPSKWVTILKSTDPAIVAKSFRRDANSSNDDQWTGGSQDPDLVKDWYWVEGSTNDKGDISNAGVIMIGKTIYFFGDRTSTSGSAQIAFWFFLGGITQNDIKGKGGFRWDGTNQEGDILGISNFINGGGTPQLTVYKRQANGALLPNGGTTHLAVNAGLETAPNTTADAAWPFDDDWTFTPKSGANQTYPSPLFFEGSIDFTNAADAKLCFTNFLLETRNSHELGASLQDFVTGEFDVVPDPPSVKGDAQCFGNDLALTATCASGGSVARWYIAAEGGNPIFTGSPLKLVKPAVGDHTRYVSCYNPATNCESARVPVKGTIYPNPAKPTSQYIGPTCTEKTFSVKVTNPEKGKYVLTQLNGNKQEKEYVSGELIFTGLTVGEGYRIVLTNANNCVSPPDDCGDFSKQTTTATPVSEERTIPTLDARIESKTKVLAAPNPFTNRVRFTLQSDISGQGSLEIFNVMGQKVQTVYQGYVEAGKVFTKEYVIPNARRANLIYVFRVGDQKTTGKLLNW